jgi:NADPH2:quinone reductase
LATDVGCQLAPRAVRTPRVYGGTGGVGHLAVQLAKARGVWVAATVSSTEAANVVLGFGADVAINRREEESSAYVERLTAGRGFDVVFDTAGGPNLDLSFAVAAPNGRVIATRAHSTHDLSPLHRKGLSLHVVFMLLPMLRNEGRERHGCILNELATLVEGGQVRPLLDPARFDLSQAPDAHHYLESGKAVGKIVVEVA